MKIFHVFLKTNQSFTVTAFKFEIDYASKGSITFFKSATEADESIVVKFENILLITPNKPEKTENKFRLYLKENRTFDVFADHFKVWSDDMISFRDADDKHISDLYVHYSDVVAILPE